MEKYILIGLVAVALLILCVQIITEIIKRASFLRNIWKSVNLRIRVMAQIQIPNK